MKIAQWSGLPLASILRGSLGLPATTFRVSLGSFKGSSLTWNSSCAEVFCFVYDALCTFYNAVLGSVLPDDVIFSCTLSGMLAHYRSNRFIQRPILVVLHVSITLMVVGSPASSVGVFYSIHLSVSKGFLSSIVLVIVSNQNMWHFQTQGHFKIFAWNKLEWHSESVEQIKTKQRMKRESFHLCKLRMENRVIQIAKADSVIKSVLS